MSASRTTRPMARQDARQRAASRRPSRAFLQPDWVRHADHGGCTDRPEVTAIERRRICDAEQEQLAGLKLPALRPGRQRTAQPVGRQHGGRRHAVDANAAARDADVLRCDGAHALEQRHARRQVAALRGQRSGIGRQAGQDDVADVQ